MVLRVGRPFWLPVKWKWYAAEVIEIRDKRHKSGLKGLGLKLGVEKSGVEMSFNLYFAHEHMKKALKIRYFSRIAEIFSFALTTQSEKGARFIWVFSVLGIYNFDLMHNLPPFFSVKLRLAPKAYLVWKLKSNMPRGIKYLTWISFFLCSSVNNCIVKVSKM